MSSRDDAAARLAALIRRTPVHAIDPEAARRNGDGAALAYHSAITAWLRDAAEAVAEIRQASLVRGASDPFARIATASELMRQEQHDAA